LSWIAVIGGRRPYPKGTKSNLLTENNEPQRFFSAQEIESFEQALQQYAPWLYPPFMLSLHTGWRKVPVLSLEWKHVDRANGIIRVPGQLTKSGQPFSILTDKTPLYAESLSVSTKYETVSYPGFF